jgi:hypothetical protein
MLSTSPSFTVRILTSWIQTSSLPSLIRTKFVQVLRKQTEQKRNRSVWTFSPITSFRHPSHLYNLYIVLYRSQWPRGVRHELSSNTGIVGSNLTRCMDVCVRLVGVCVVLCVGSGLATGWSPVQGVLPTVYRLRNWKSGQGPQGL